MLTPCVPLQEPVQFEPPPLAPPTTNSLKLMMPLAKPVLQDGVIKLGENPMLCDCTAES